MAQTVPLMAHTQALQALFLCLLYFRMTCLYDMIYLKAATTVSKLNINRQEGVVQKADAGHFGSRAGAWLLDWPLSILNREKIKTVINVPCLALSGNLFTLNYSEVKLFYIYLLQCIFQIPIPSSRIDLPHLSIYDGYGGKQIVQIFMPSLTYRDN